MTVIQVDQQMCMGHARCNAVAPEVYPLDDDGFVDAEKVSADGSDLASARRGAEACPERALHVQED